MALTVSDWPGASGPASANTTTAPKSSAPNSVSSSGGPGYTKISVDGEPPLYIPSSWLPMPSNPSYNSVVASYRTKYVTGSTSTTTKDDKTTFTYSPSGGGGGVTINTPEQKKSNDKPQMDALKKMIDGFKTQRDTKLGNITTNYKQTDADILKGYSERAAQLELSREDNNKAEHDASFANLVNMARERADILSQTAMQGAGESDTLKSQLMALRNWDANQGDINRSFFDTMRSINSAVTELNADTRSSRISAYQAAQGDRAQVWNDYYNQNTSTYTQMGNIAANPYSDAYDKGANYFDKAADQTAKAFKDEGTPSSIRNWEGSTKAVEQRMNNTQAWNRTTNLAEKKPEGATLRSW